MDLSDTIVAIATPPGRGGIGVIRISGPRSKPIAEAILHLSRELRSWQPTRADLLNEQTQAVDDVIVTYFAGPRSYTAEDVVEIACHGSPVVLRHGVAEALKQGARAAEPGEFTLRAFVNGRIDLPQAEAVRDLIDATTLHQARVAAQQASGSLARRLQPVKAQLLELIALLEAGIDFAEDDISVATQGQLRARLDPIAADVNRLARSFSYGHVLREGFTLAIIGRPNVGKSSLFNRLLEQDRAIVTPVAGTTRDLVSEVVAIEGIPVRLVDTAGIRTGEDLVESLGIERSLSAMADADVTLVVVDANHIEEQDQELIDKAGAQGRHLIVANKVDQGGKAGPDMLPVSALTGQGIDELREAIVRAVAPDGVVEQNGAIITNLRQQDALSNAQSALSQAHTAIVENIPHEMLLLDLYDALGGLDELTGRTTADDILNRIFSTFCIGK